MESDIGELVPGPGALPAAGLADDRYADTGRLLITCPGRPGIVAAVPNFLFVHGELPPGGPRHRPHQDTTIVFS